MRPSSPRELCPSRVELIVDLRCASPLATECPALPVFQCTIRPQFLFWVIIKVQSTVCCTVPFAALGTIFAIPPCFAYTLACCRVTVTLQRSTTFIRIRAVAVGVVAVLGVQRTQRLEGLNIRVARAVQSLARLPPITVVQTNVGVLPHMLRGPPIRGRQLGHRSEETLSTKEACDAPIRKSRVEVPQMGVVLLARPVQARGSVPFVRRSAARGSREILVEAVAVAGASAGTAS